MPEQPRVDMPHVYRRGSAQQLIVGPPVHNPDPTVNVDFLKQTDYGLVEPLEFSTWGYDLRRQGQSILPFLFVAPMSTCKEVDFLTKHGITLLVGIHPREGASIFTAGVSRVARERGLEHHVVSYDHSALLIQSFSHANFLINSHLAKLKEQGRVVVYCHSGNEKSPTFIAAYLMETFKGMASAESAMSVVLTRRFCVHFDEEARRMLKAYEDILSARNQVLGTTMGVRGREKYRAGDVSSNIETDPKLEALRTRYLKRERDGFLHNVDDAQWMDKERFAGRVFVPFKDDEAGVEMEDMTV
jgi:serine/threonine/tyrosine-interacting protein